MVASCSKSQSLVLQSIKIPPFAGGISYTNNKLFDDLGNNARTDGAATFADSEAVIVVHSDWSVELNLEGDGITRHDNLFFVFELNLTGNVGGAEVELWLVTIGGTVACNHWRMVYGDRPLPS